MLSRCARHGPPPSRGLPPDDHARLGRALRHAEDVRVYPRAQAKVAGAEVGAQGRRIGMSPSPNP
jgi:hypothetical protein